MDHVDPLYCYRPDPETHIEELVFVMSDIIASGLLSGKYSNGIPEGAHREIKDLFDSE